MDFDPLTGKLWDTENGPTFGDEINLVEPGFNSGWNKVQGIWTVTGERNNETPGSSLGKKPNLILEFSTGKEIQSPELTWGYMGRSRKVFKISFY